MVVNRVLESGLLTVNLTDIAVVRRKLTRSPATPLKLTRPFWPGTVIGIEAAAPPGVAVADASAGTLKAVSVIVTGEPPDGSITIV